MRAAISATLLALGGLGCSDGTSPQSPCEGDVGLSVNIGPEVVFDWDGSCNPARLEVSPDDFESMVWAIEGSLAPPVTFAELPAGAETVVPPGELEPGRSYFLSIIVPEDGRVRVVEYLVFER